MSSVLDLIDAIEAGKTRECESTFEELIHAKIAEKMEERRAEISANMFESEQLDELSKDTLGAYVKKASKERGYSGLEAGSAGAGSKEQKDAVNTMKKRQAGVVKAVDRLTKESEDLEEEQLDELSKDTLSSYAKKANQSAMSAAHAAGSKTDVKSAGPHIDKMYKRKDGVNKAIDRLTKESDENDEEQIDEVGALSALAIGHAISGNNIDHSKLSAQNNMQKAGQYAQYTGKKPELPTTLMAKSSAGSMINKARGM